MAVKRKKCEDKLMAKYKMPFTESKRFYTVFLWEDQQSFDENTMDNCPGEAAACVNHIDIGAMVNTKGGKVKLLPPRKLGEIHFIKDKWNIEIIAHETMHVFLNRMRVLSPKLCDIMRNIDDEEFVCFEFGQWVQEIHRILSEENPQI